MNRLQPLTMPLRGLNLIEASAGTGKTYTITTLYLRLLLGLADPAQPTEGLAVDQLLVVTFTEAATEEIRDRVRKRLNEAKQAIFLRDLPEYQVDPLLTELIGQLPDADLAYKRLDAAVKMMDEAAIFTIHGFCQRMLKQHAFESGSLFDNQFILDQREYLEKSIKDFWRCTVYPLTGTVLNLFLQCWSSPAALLADLQSLLNHQADILIPQVSEAQLLEDIEHYSRLSAEVKGIWLNEEIPALINDSGVTKSRKPAKAVYLDAFGEFCQSGALEFIMPGGKDSWELWSEASLRKATPKAKEPPQHSVFGLFSQLAELKSGLKTRVQAFYRQQAFLQVKENLAAEKKLAQKISPDDLLLNLAAALSEEQGGVLSEQLAQKIARQFPLAMIDEFQDTDPLQYRIFNAIYGGAGSDRADGGMIMIGDPKQAIYGFRGADIFTYIGAKHDVGEQQHYTLDTNWRSASALIHAVNGIFAGSSQPFIYDQAIPFNPVNAADKADKTPLRIDDDDSPGALTLWHLAGADDMPLSKAHGIEALASRTANEIATLLNKAKERQPDGVGLAQPPSGTDSQEAAKERLSGTDSQGEAKERLPDDAGLAQRPSGTDSLGEAKERLPDGAGPAQPPSGTDSQGEAKGRLSGTDSQEAARERLPDGAGPAQPPSGTDSQGEAKGRLSGTDSQEAARERLPDGAGIGERALQAGDICVLVRDRNEADSMRQALSQVGVSSVYLSRQSVFETPLAYEFYLLLQAIYQQKDERAIRAALITAFFHYSIEQLWALTQDEARWQQILDQFVRLHQVWQRSGVMAVLQHLLVHNDLAGLWQLQFAQPERMLTDIRHIGELLQQKSMELEGGHRLLGWFHEQLLAAKDEGKVQQLRLENDSNLVQIVTMHASKGLEYHIVFLPFVCGYRAAKSAIFHDDQHELVIDFANDPEHLQQADRERLAEDLRLLYVALTRGVYRCYLGVFNLKVGNAKASHLPHTALGYLLGLAEAGVKVNNAGIAGALLALKERLNTLPGSCHIETIEMAPEPVMATAAVTAQSPLVFTPFAGRIESDWKVTSYSALSHGVASVQVLPGATDEGEAATDQPPPEPGDGLMMPATPDRFSFPKGAEAGSCLHEILEEVDFAAFAADPDQPHAVAVVEQTLEKYGIDGLYADAARQWLAAVLNTRLNRQGLTLAQIPGSQRLVEMEFYLPMARVRATQINQILSRHLQRPVEDFDFIPVQGVLKGYIDLIVQWQGQYFVLDYKSNHLGMDNADYGPQALEQGMDAHHYHLQYLLYTLALHRYLKQRLVDYDYERHIGGNYYLFLRGMDPDNRHFEGVYFSRPSMAVMRQLDTIFSGEVNSSDKLTEHSPQQLGLWGEG